MFKKEVPVGWFAILIVLWVISYSVSFVRQGEHFSEMEAFMAKGDRFTGQDGRDMAGRIDALEHRIMLLEAE